MIEIIGLTNECICRMSLNLMNYYDYTMKGNPYIFTVSLMIVFFGIRESGGE
jgi:hypothetical protein